MKSVALSEARNSLPALVEDVDATHEIVGRGGQGEEEADRRV